LSTDWVQLSELGMGRFEPAILRELEALRGRATVLVSKVEIIALAYGAPELAIDRRYYNIARHVREHFVKTGETRFFELYQ
jgi:hypothetical protein